MYKDSLSISNKIIQASDIEDIIALMNEKIIEIEKVTKNVEKNNEILERQYQRWDLKDEGSELNFDVSFYDSSSVKLDNYIDFITVFHNRLEDIKDFSVCFRYSYSAKTDDSWSYDVIYQSISIYVREYKMEVDVSIKKDDNHIKDVYELIKNKVLNARPRYDKVIEKRSMVIRKVYLGFGLIPAIILVSALLFVPDILKVLKETYVGYPIIVFLLGYGIGFMFKSSKILGLYDPLIPETVYAGHDSSYNSIYKEDIESYKGAGEVLIGKNVNNLKKRKEIVAMYKKYKGRVPIALVTIIVISILIIVI